MLAIIADDFHASSQVVWMGDDQEGRTFLLSHAFELGAYPLHYFNCTEIRDITFLNPHRGFEAGEVLCGYRRCPNAVSDLPLNPYVQVARYLT